MEKKTAGLVGALAGLASMGAAHAAVQPAAQMLQVSAYSDLLKPIPNASEMLKLSNAELMQKAAQARVVQAQYYENGPPPPQDHHHHHHHHQAYYPPPPPPPVYHHHHHHHNSVTIAVPGVGVVQTN